jgi:hypothetical protein
MTEKFGLQRMRNQPDRYTKDYLQETRRDLERISINVFLCGAGQPLPRRRETAHSQSDIRSYLKEKIRTELDRCDVKFGEHKELISAFRKVAGKAANLADHELGLARRKKMDLVIIFPCSPGSFAELGMFSVAERIAPKMIVFVDLQHRRNDSYLRHGPIKAAALRRARVFFVDYKKREHIWRRVRDLVLEQKSRKRSSKLLTR